MTKRRRREKSGAKNPVTWGKELRAQSKAKKEPMFCLAYNCQENDCVLGETVYFTGTADPDFFEALRNFIFSRVKLDEPDTNDSKLEVSQK